MAISLLVDCELYFCVQVVHEVRNYPYPQLHLLALQSLSPSRHASAVRESYEVTHKHVHMWQINNNEHK